MSLITMNHMKSTDTTTSTFARSAATSRYEHPSRYENRMGDGSAMPLDTEIHWTWDNPLNIIPALIVLFLLLALIAILV